MWRYLLRTTHTLCVCKHVFSLFCILQFQIYIKCVFVNDHWVSHFRNLKLCVRHIFVFVFHSCKKLINTITLNEWIDANILFGKEQIILPICMSVNIIFINIIYHIYTFFLKAKVCQCLQTIQQDVDLCVTAHRLWYLVSSYTSQDRTLLAASPLSLITGRTRLLVRDPLAHIS